MRYTRRPPASLLEAVVERLKVSPDVARERIRDMSLHDRLDHFLSWNGVIGFTEDIMAIVNDALDSSK